MTMGVVQYHVRRIAVAPLHIGRIPWISGAGFNVNSCIPREIVEVVIRKNHEEISLLLAGRKQRWVRGEGQNLK